MTDYLVTTYNCQGTIAVVIAALETKLETIDNGKTIHYLDVKLEGHLWHGFIIYAT